MTPYQLARQECSNYQSDGSCLGIQPEGLTDPSVPMVPLDRCLLSTKPIKPCRFFEKCVLPLADQPDSAGGRIDGAKRAGWLEAQMKYLAARKKTVPETKLRTCPDCGDPLAKRQRVCEKCSKKRRRDSQRELMRSRREAVSS